MASILTTLYYPRRPAWVERVEMIDPDTLSRPALLRMIVGESRRYDALVLNGSVGLGGGYVDLAAAALVGRRRSAPLVVLSECAWKLGVSGLDRRLRRVGIRLVDHRRIVYCVLSSAERSTFARTWGLDPERVVFTPFCHNLAEEELEAPTRDDGYVFAGGNAFRDYEPLLSIAPGLAADVVLATETISADRRAALPSRVRVEPADGGRFMELLRGARVVVVPMRAGLERAAGLLTYLTAMALGKPVVVTRAPGTDDYVHDGETGIVVPPGDPAALEGVLRRLLDHEGAGERAALGRRAAEAARVCFSPDAYVASLLEVVDRFASSERASRHAA